MIIILVVLIVLVTARIRRVPAIRTSRYNRELVLRDGFARLASSSPCPELLDDSREVFGVNGLG
jgi:hypothetical protein